MNVYVVVKAYAYEGESVLTAGTDWDTLYNFAKNESEYLEREGSKDSMIIYTFENGMEVSVLKL